MNGKEHYKAIITIRPVAHRRETYRPIPRWTHPIIAAIIIPAIAIMAGVDVLLVVNAVTR